MLWDTKAFTKREYLTRKKTPQRVAPAHTHSHFTARSSASRMISAVAQGQTEFAFQHTFGRPDRCKRLPTSKWNRILTYVWASYTHDPRGRFFSAQTKFAFHHVWASDTHNLVEGHVSEATPWPPCCQKRKYRNFRSKSAEGVQIQIDH
jgi:hypothetical protein